MTVIIPTPEERDELLALQKRNDETLRALDEMNPSPPKPAQSKPGFYAVMTAAIRYNQKLSWMEKVLYVEIVALCGKEGYCFASNSYFAKTFGVSVRTVSRAINNLIDKGFIFALYETSNSSSLRKIYIREAALEQIPFAVNMSEGGGQNCLGGVDKNVYHNNTSINNTPNTNNTSINNKKNTVSIPPSEGEAPSGSLKSIAWLGSNTHARLGRLYELLWQSVMGVPHKLQINGKNGSILKNLLQNDTEVMVALMLVAHFEWKGMEGTDLQTFKNLQNNGFPLSWMPSRASLYKAYILNKMGLKSEEDQLEALKKVLIKINPGNH